MPNLRYPVRATPHQLKRRSMINYGSLVPPLSELPILGHLKTVLDFLIGLHLTEDDLEDLDLWLAPLGRNEVNTHGRVRLSFNIGEREFCRIPLRVLLNAEASYLSRCN